MKRVIGALVLAAALSAIAGRASAGPHSESDSGASGRPWLGVRLQAVTPELAEALKLGGEQGALVSDVKEGSPAEEAGVEEGDVIVRIGDRAVDGPDAAVHAINQGDPGESVEITVVREGRRVATTARLAVEPAPPRRVRRPMMARDREPAEPAEPRSFLGVRTEELDEDLAAYFGTTRGRGVLVTRVLPQSPAEKAGLRSGDVILQVGPDRVGGAEELQGAVSRHAPGESVKLNVLRQKREKEIEVALEEAPAIPRGDPDWFGSFRDSMRGFGGRFGADRGEANARIRGEIDKLKDEVESLRREIEDLKRKGS